MSMSPNSAPPPPSTEIAILYYGARYIFTILGWDLRTLVGIKPLGEIAYFDVSLFYIFNYEKVLHIYIHSIMKQISLTLFYDGVQI